MNPRRIRALRDWESNVIDDGLPPPSIRDNGAPTWDAVHQICARLVADWERMPEYARRAYAFPNPEDR